MQRRNMFLVGFLLIVLLVPVGLSAAQGGGVPLPANAGGAYLLYPDVIVDAPAGAGTLQQQYILLAKAGNVLSVTANMSNPGVVTGLDLTDANGMVLAQGMPDTAAPTTISLSYEVAAEGWYFVNVSLGMAVSPANTYSLMLTGTTRAVYDMLGFDAPPSIPGAHLVVASQQVNGTLEANPVPFLFPLMTGDTLSVTAQGPSQPRLRITPYSGGAAGQALIAEPAQAGGPVNYNVTSDQDQWLRIDVEPTTPGTFTLDVSLPRASGMVSDLGLGGDADMPAAGAEMCGNVPARYGPGDVLTVTEAGDDLLLLNDYTAGNEGALGLAVEGDRLEVVAPPVCYSSPTYGRDLWYYNVFAYKNNVSGWVLSGLGADPWLCGEGDPDCGQQVTCELSHATASAGDMFIVTQAGDNLLIMSEPGNRESSLGLALTDEQLEVVSGPTCVYSEAYGGGLWYWEVYSDSRGVTGWVQDGTASETWVCNADDPACVGQDVTCAVPHAQAGPGDVLVVTQQGDDLRLMAEPAKPNTSLALVGTGDQLEVVDGPTCVFVPQYGGGLWYWNVFSTADNLSGWVQDGTGAERWVCPASDPNCGG